MKKTKSIFAGIAISTMLCNVSVCKSQEENAEENLLEWKEGVKLSWDDYQGEPKKEEELAHPETTIKHHYYQDLNTYGRKQKGKNDLFKCGVKCYFDKSKSWKAKEVPENLLEHEQGHFDITEIHARKLRKYLTGVKKYNDDTKKEIKEKVKEVLMECKKMEKLYDKETNRNQNTEKQAEWLKKIEKELDDFSKYKE